MMAQLQQKPKETVVLGWRGSIPVIEVVPRIDWPQGWRFYCNYCKRWHLHGEMLQTEEHRVAHCDCDKNSPYLKDGYYLQKAEKYD